MAQYNLSPSGGSSIPTPVSIANGGTGSATQNFVDLTTAQTVAGVKRFSTGTVVGGTTQSPTYGTFTVNGGMTTLPNTNGKLQVGRYSAAVPHSHIKIGTGSASLRFTNAADSTDHMTITDTGNVGIGTTSPLSTLDVLGGFGLARIATTAAAYTVAVNVSIVELTAATAQTVTLPAVSTNTRRLITITNPTAINKTLGSFLNLQGIATTTIEPYGWLILQSDGTNWRMISGSSPVLKSLSANSLYATAIANTTLTLGELTFRYSANATNGNLEVRSSTAATVPVSFYVDRENVGFLGAYANTTSRGNVTAAINTGAFTVLNAGNIGDEQIASYRIMTGNNIYLVSIANFQSKITISVEKKI
jgi:hypothetical protein